MAGRGRKGGRGEDLGRALIRQQNRAAAAAKERGEALASASRRRAPPLESVIDVSDIDAVLLRAAEEDRLHSALAASAPSSFDNVIDLDVTDETAEQRRRLRKEQEGLHAGSLGVPRRPPWHKQMTVEELDESERGAFLVWRRNLASWSWLLMLEIPCSTDALILRYTRRNLMNTREQCFLSTRLIC